MRVLCYDSAVVDQWAHCLRFWCDLIRNNTHWRKFAFLLAIIPSAVSAADDSSVVVQFRNSLGMEMRLIPGGSFWMGTDLLVEHMGKAQALYGPRHGVRLSSFYIGRAEVTRAQYHAFLNDLGETHPWRAAQKWLKSNNMESTTSDQAPVVGLTWDQANEFCLWLSRKEETRYRLPREAEWEYCCHGGIGGAYWWGDDWGEREQSVAYRTGNVGEPFRGRPKPFGFYPQNAFGLYDVLGNAYEWTADWHDGELQATYRDGPADDPQGPDSGAVHIMRGGGVHTTEDVCNCYHRGVDVGPGGGFRVVCELDEGRRAALCVADTCPISTQSDEPEISIQLNLEARNIELPGGRWMAFRLVPEGEFVLGSHEAEAPGFRTPDEGRLTRVRMAECYWIGETEVTQSQLCALVDVVAGDVLGDELPAHGPGWSQMREYVRLLNDLGHRDGQLASGEVLRLPTETEWEYACRAGSEGAFCFGNSYDTLDQYAWLDQAAGPFPVAQKRPNAWGLYDMHGNVWEFCDSKKLEYPGDAKFLRSVSSALDSYPVRRGGAWAFAAHRARCAARQFTMSRHYDGFRLVIAPTRTRVTK